MVPRPPQPDTGKEGPFRRSLVAAARGLGRALTDGEADALEAHHRLLHQWSRRMNLTGLKDESDILKRHFLEPIAAADLLGDRGTLLDLGSGNGFPAVPLKVLHPGLDLILVESSEKKSAFLWAVLRELGLKGSRVETRRIRRLADLADLLPCRYLTLRAVRGQEFLRGEGLRILEPEGRALLFVTSEEVERIQRDPLLGLILSGSRRLPSGPESVVAILEPAP